MATTGFRGKHLITCEDWKLQEINTVLSVARELKRKFAMHESHSLLTDQTIFKISYGKATQTSKSFKAAITQLGGNIYDWSTDAMEVQDNESAKDAARILSRIGHAIVCKNYFYGVGNQYINELARWASVPVISLQDDIYHPIQALADLMTIQENFGENLTGLKIGITWAHTTSFEKPLSVTQSQILLFARYGMDITVAMPNEFPLMKNIVHKARNNAQLGGGKIKTVDNMEEALKGAQVIIPQNWGGFAYFPEYFDNIDHRNAMKSNLERYKNWTCDLNLLCLGDIGVKLLHTLPIERGNEITDEVLDGDASLIFDEAENCLHIAKAVMALTMGGR